ncbi:MAG: protein-L-isoaspartate O-methyltransferase [Alphaproteobacteria bacterium]|nr:protein-L-isoaspartate O-methyltransferase [Alphaproteobacteria bacterium]
MHRHGVLDFAKARRNMVEGQLRPNGVTDNRLLDAMGSIPRELFVPPTHVGIAYSDAAIPLMPDRWMMPPLPLARLLEAASIGPKDRVLELAAGTGYATLVLAMLTSSVASVEPNALLHKEAAKNVETYAPGRTQMLAGAPVEGCIAHAPFDVIFINGSVDFLPDYLFSQLEEGGRLVAIVREHDRAHIVHMGHARVYRKIKGEISSRDVFDANVPPAPGFVAEESFSFC